MEEVIFPASDNKSLAIEAVLFSNGVMLVKNAEGQWEKPRDNKAFFVGDEITIEFSSETDAME